MWVMERPYSCSSKKEVAGRSKWIWGSEIAKQSCVSPCSTSFTMNVWISMWILCSEGICQCKHPTAPQWATMGSYTKMTFASFA